MIDGLWSQIEVPSAEFDVSEDRLKDIVDARLEKEEATDNETAREAATTDMKTFRAGLVCDSRQKNAAVAYPDHQGDVARIRSQNPHAVGEMVNHPPEGRTANVMGWPVDLDFSKGEAYMRAAPNAYGLRPDGAASPGAPCPYTVVMVAAETLRPGDELWLDYGCELLEVDQIPIWFTPAALRGDANEKDPAANPALAIKDELQAWRTGFETRMGRKPNRQDMFADPVAAGLFETFQSYRKLGDL